MSKINEPLMFDDNQTLLAEIRASDRFPKVTIEYWLGWILNQNLVILNAKEVLDWIGKMEKMIAKGIDYDIPDHWIGGE